MSKGIFTEGFEDAVQLQRSPTVEGLIQGGKAAMIGAPIGALVQALRGKNPILGAIMGAAAMGIPAGLGGAGAQKLSNLDQEAIIRYHSERIKEREPMFFMPPPKTLGAIFSKYTRGPNVY